MFRPWKRREEEETHLRSGRLVPYSGIQPAVVQLFLAIHLLQKPLGLNQSCSVPTHPSSQA